MRGCSEAVPCAVRAGVMELMRRNSGMMTGGVSLLGVLRKMERAGWRCAVEGDVSMRTFNKRREEEE